MSEFYIATNMASFIGTEVYTVLDHLNYKEGLLPTNHQNTDFTRHLISKSIIRS